MNDELNWAEIDMWIAELRAAADDPNPFQMLYRANRAATFLRDLGYLLDEQVSAFKIEFANLVLREIAMYSLDEPDWGRIQRKFHLVVGTAAHLLGLSRTPTADFE